MTLLDMITFFSFDAAKPPGWNAIKANQPEMPDWYYSLFLSLCVSLSGSLFFWWKPSHRATKRESGEWRGAIVIGLLSSFFFPAVERTGRRRRRDVMKVGRKAKETRNVGQQASGLLTLFSTVSSVKIYLYIHVCLSWVTCVWVGGARHDRAPAPVSRDPFVRYRTPCICILVWMTVKIKMALFIYI